MSSDRRDDRKRDSGRSDDRKRTHETNKNDAKSIRCRVFVGNLNTDVLTRHEFEKVFAEHGKVIGASIHNGFGFVQYEKESEADEAVLKRHATIIKDKRVDVNLAGDRRKPADERYGTPGGAGKPPISSKPRGHSPSPPRRGPPPYRERDRDLLPPDPYGPPRERDDYRGPDYDYPPVDPYPLRPGELSPKRMRPDYDYPPPPAVREPIPPPYVKPPPQGTPIDCEVIIINKQQRGYADMVEKKLKSHGLVVECAHLPETVTLASELDDACRRGVLYGIIISSQHEVHHSVTVHILHGTQQEHRNMPLEDAIKLVSRNFDMYMQALREREQQKEKAPASLDPLDSTPGAYGAVNPPPAAYYSREISLLLNMAADGKLLTADQYSQLINELTSLRNDLLKKEGRSIPSAASSSKPFPTDPQSIALQQAELQAKILSILNPSNKAKSTPELNSQENSTPVSEAKPVAKIPVLTPSNSASTAFKPPTSSVSSSYSSSSAPSQYSSNIIGMAMSKLRGVAGQSPSQVTSSASYYRNSTSYPQTSPYAAASGVANSAWSQTQYRVPTVASSNHAGTGIPTNSPGYAGARINTIGSYPSAVPNYYQRY